MRRIIFGLLILFAQSLANAQTVETRSADVRFERHQFAVARHRGHVYLDGRVTKRPIGEQPELVSLIETFDQVKFNSDRDFFDRGSKLRSTRTYTYDDVLFSDDQGKLTKTPLVLLPGDERSRVEPAWQAWLAQREAEQQEYKQQRIAYETEQAFFKKQQEALARLVEANEAAARSLAVASGETSLWEVEVVKGHVSINYQAYGRSSDEAARQVLGNNPGFQLGSIRRIAGY